MAKSINAHAHSVLLGACLLIIISLLSEKPIFSEAVLPYSTLLFFFFKIYVKIQSSLASLVFHERKHFLCRLELKNATVGVVFLFLPLKPRNIFFFLH